MIGNQANGTQHISYPRLFMSMDRIIFIKRTVLNSTGSSISVLLTLVISSINIMFVLPFPLFLTLLSSQCA